MKTSFEMPGEGDFSDPPLLLKLFLAYEDEATAERAKRALHHVLSQPEVQAQPQLQLWKLAELVAPEQRARALQAAAEADVLVVSLHSGKRLTPEADAVLKQWVGLARSKPCALVLSLDADAKPLAETYPALQELRAAASRNGITVMLQFAETQLSDLETVLTEIERRAETLPEMSDEFLDRVDLYRHWGLNE